MKHVLVLIFLFYNFVSLAQQRFQNYPSNLVQLSNHLTQNLSNDKEKVRSIYNWITKNIDYDYYKKKKQYKNNAEIISDVLKRRKGVCQHYAQLFDTLCKLSHIKSYMILGYNRDKNGEIPKEGHAWNAVVINNKYYLIDATWGAGYSVDNKFIRDLNDDYYMKKPEIFLQDHMPFDPVYQFVSNPINQEDFFYQNFDKLKTKGTFNYRDTLALMSIQNNTDKVIGQYKRTRNCKVTNTMTKTYLDNLLRNYTYDVFNYAIKWFNQGINDYNKYVQHKNRQFRQVDEATIRILITNAEKSVLQSQTIMRQLFDYENIAPELKGSIHKNFLNMKRSLQRISDDIQFVNTYYKSNKWTRKRMFYK